MNEDGCPSMTCLSAKLENSSGYAHVARMFRRGGDYSGIINSVYTPSGSRNLVEPAITVTHADGNTSLDLKHVSRSEQKAAISPPPASYGKIRLPY